uniref:Uncharacterized protein n=1 Tax=Ananas comosus var. bracteatus TaxID=296719 RepID=A0A6V7QTX2_ANACO
MDAEKWKAHLHVRFTDDVVNHARGILLGKRAVKIPRSPAHPSRDETPRVRNLLAHFPLPKMAKGRPRNPLVPSHPSKTLTLILQNPVPSYPIALPVPDLDRKRSCGSRVVAHLFLR